MYYLTVQIGNHMRLLFRIKFNQNKIEVKIKIILGQHLMIFDPKTYL